MSQPSILKIAASLFSGAKHPERTTSCTDVEPHVEEVRYGKVALLFVDEPTFALEHYSAAQNRGDIPLMVASGRQWIEWRSKMIGTHLVSNEEKAQEALQMAFDDAIRGNQQAQRFFSDAEMVTNLDNFIAPLIKRLVDVFLQSIATEDREMILSPNELYEVFGLGFFPSVGIAERVLTEAAAARDPDFLREHCSANSYDPLRQDDVGERARQTFEKLWDIVARASILRRYLESSGIKLKAENKDRLLEEYLQIPSRWEFLQVPAVARMEAVIGETERLGLQLEGRKLSKLATKAAFSGDVEGVLKELRAIPSKQQSGESAGDSCWQPIEPATTSVEIRSDKQRFLKVLEGYIPQSEAGGEIQSLLWELHKRFGVSTGELKSKMSDVESPELIGRVLSGFRDRLLAQEQATADAKHDETTAVAQDNQEQPTPASPTNHSVAVSEFLLAGESTYRASLRDLDDKAQRAIESRVNQFESENFGMHRKIDGTHGCFVSWSRQRGGPRVYYYRAGDDVILLRAGMAATQKRDSQWVQGVEESLQAARKP